MRGILLLSLLASPGLGCAKKCRTAPEAPPDAAAAGGAQDEKEAPPKAEEESPYLDVANFNRVVEEHAPEIVACYRETAGKAEGAPTGRVKATIVVDGDGKVKKVSFDPQRSTLKHEGLNKCVEDKAKAWRFNITLTGGESPMPYTFDLTAGAMLAGG